jgi:NTE family protein
MFAAFMRHYGESRLAAEVATDFPQVSEERRRDPVIGLALGGGAARGWAHIGIMQVLEAAGIRPSIVVGTSIGAVVGGCWAGGKLGELDTFARSLTKHSVFRMMDFSLRGSGLISGGRLKRALDENFGDLDITDLPVRFAAIATELGSGHEIWLTRGRLVEAMRASYALPGVFVPVKVAGRWLIDGALVNPVPVSAARALGADLVIGVNLHADVFGRSAVIHNHGEVSLDPLTTELREPGRRKVIDQVRGAAQRVLPFQRGAEAPREEAPPGIGTVMMDAFNIVQDRIARSRLAGDPPDVTISPKLGRIGLSDFHRAAEAIAHGRTAAERSLTDIYETRDALADLPGH